MQALSEEQWAGLNGRELGGLSAAQLQSLGTDILATLGPAALRGLSSAQLAAQSPQQIAAIKPEHLRLFSGKELRALPKFEPIQTPSRPELAIELDFDIAPPLHQPASLALALPSPDVAPVLALASLPQLSELLTPAQDALLGAPVAEPTRALLEDSATAELSPAMLQELQRMTQEALFDGRNQLLI